MPNFYFFQFLFWLTTKLRVRCYTLARLCSSALTKSITLFFYYKNTFYMNIEAEICEFKNILRINPRMRFSKGYNFLC